MSSPATDSASRPKLTAAGIGRLATVLVSAILQAAIFFLAAGRIDLPRAWLYYGALLGYLIVSIALMLVFFPAVADVVNERGKVHADVKTWDKVFGISYTLLLFIVPVVAGLDAGRFGWSSVSAAWAVPAVVVTLLSYLFVHWATMVNRYAETGVRTRGMPRGGSAAVTDANAAVHSSATQATTTMDRNVVRCMTAPAPRSPRVPGDSRIGRSYPSSGRTLNLSGRVWNTQP